MRGEASPAVAPSSSAGTEWKRRSFASYRTATGTCAAAPACCCLILVLGHVVCPPASGCERSGSDRQIGDTIVLIHGPAIPQALVDAAITLWEGCRNYGLDFPRFLIGNQGERHGSSQVVEIQFGGNNSGSGACAVFNGRRIVLFSEALSDSGTLGCSRRAANLAHELGHVLGLRHPADPDPHGRIMGPVPRTGGSPRRIFADECSAAGAAWLTSAEVAAESDDYPSLRQP